jgi:hypothetical protein
VVTDVDTVDVRADGLHHPGPLVAEQGRQRDRVPLVAHDQVGVADARADEADQNLVRARVGELEKLEFEGCAT